MIKSIYCLFILVAFSGNIISQETEVEFGFGFQKHDKRIDGDSEFDSDPGAWGTYYLNLNVKKSVPVLDRFAVEVGIGYAKEMNTYHTPYNHCYFNKPGATCAYVLAHIKLYTIDMITTSFTPTLKITNDISFKFKVLPQFHFRKTAAGYGRQSKFIFGLYSIEFNPELNLTIGKAKFGLGYRLYQLKTIDPVYSYDNNFLRDNPGYPDRNFDTYNPTKVMLTLGLGI